MYNGSELYNIYELKGIRTLWYEASKCLYIYIMYMVIYERSDVCLYEKYERDLFLHVCHKSNTICTNYIWIYEPLSHHYYFSGYIKMALNKFKIIDVRICYNE